MLLQVKHHLSYDFLLWAISFYWITGKLFLHPVYFSSSSLKLYLMDKTALLKSLTYFEKCYPDSIKKFLYLLIMDNKYRRVRSVSNVKPEIV